MENKKQAISRDLIPVAFAGKNTGTLGYFNVWVGIGIIIATFTIGGEAARYCSLEQIIVASLAGTLILGFLFCFTGDIGVEHGVAFPTYVGALLGLRGTAIPNLLRTVYGPIWFGVQSYFGATAINQIVYTFSGYSNWKLWFVVFVIVQVINTACGFKAMEKFANIAAPSIILIGIYIAVRLIALADTNGIQIWGTVYESEPHLGAGGLAAFLSVTILNMNYWADNACEVETWSRYVKTTPGEKSVLKRNKKGIPGYLIALPLASGFMVFLGALSTFVTGNYNPIEAINAVTKNPLILSLLLLMIIFAQWSTNVVANLMPSGMCIVALFHSKIPYWLGIVICGTLGALIQPWVLVDHIGIFLTVTGSLWSTLYGMTIADYLLIRRRRLNVPDLYKPVGDSQFSFVNGFNPAGVLAFVIGLVSCMIFSDYAFIAGVIVSCISYYLLAKYWVFRKYPQVELEGGGEAFYGTSEGREWLYDESRNIVYPSK